MWETTFPIVLIEESLVSVTVWEEPVSPRPQMHPKPPGKCSQRRPQALAGLMFLASLGH